MLHAKEDRLTHWPTSSFETGTGNINLHNLTRLHTHTARPTSRCILFEGENISFDASLVIYVNSTNIPPITIINRIYENQNLLTL